MLTMPSSHWGGANDKTASHAAIVIAKPPIKRRELVFLELGVDVFDTLGDFRQVAGCRRSSLTSRLFVLRAKCRVSSLRADYQHVGDSA